MGDVSHAADWNIAKINNGIISTRRTVLIVQFRDNHTVCHFSNARHFV